MDGGILYRKANADFLRRMVVKVTEVNKLLHDKHDHVLAGHQGVDITLTRSSISTIGKDIILFVIMFSREKYVRTLDLATP